MTRADDAADVSEEAADLVEHLLAHDRVRVHQRTLGVVKRPGLVDDLGWDLHLADVVQQRGELRALALLGIEPEPVGDGDDELDDVTAVSAGVLVVGLDHVAEQHCRAAICARQLEGMVDAHLALACEDLEQRHERQDEEHAPRCPLRRDCHGEAHRRQRGVDENRHAHRARVRQDGNAPAAPRPDRARYEVGRELGRERKEIDRHELPRGFAGGGEAEDDGRTERMPRIAQDDRDVRRSDLPTRQPGRLAEEIAERDKQRHRPWREQEEHGHEYELRLVDESVAQLELDARHECVREHGNERRPDRERPNRRKEQRGTDRSRKEASADGERQRFRSPAEPELRASAGTRNELRLDIVGMKGQCRRAGEGGHSVQGIGNSNEGVDSDSR